MVTKWLPKIHSLFIQENAYLIALRYINASRAHDVRVRWLWEYFRCLSWQLNIACHWLRVIRSWRQLSTRISWLTTTTWCIISIIRIIIVIKIWVIVKVILIRKIISLLLILRCCWLCACIWWRNYWSWLTPWIIRKRFIAIEWICIWRDWRYYWPNRWLNFLDIYKKVEILY